MVGDMGTLPDSLPIFLIPDVPLSFETLKIIAPTAFAIATVGLLESLMTASIVDELTDTTSDKIVNVLARVYLISLQGLLAEWPAAQ